MLNNKGTKQSIRTQKQTQKYEYFRKHIQTNPIHSPLSFFPFFADNQP